MRTALLGLAVAGALVHMALLGGWLLDDAAISAAYARNLAAGHGLVPFPGAERVEGYSNATWVALLAAAEVLGLDALAAAKGLGIVLAACTVPVVARLARLAAPADAAAPSVAAVALAASSGFAVWAASGMESALLSLLLAAGLVTALQEDAGRWRPSALWFAALAATRPEGIAYAVPVAVALGVRDRRPPVWWLLWLAFPLLAYHGLRVAWFAWPAPMTYYAKVDTRAAELFDFDGSGWRYLRGFATGSAVWIALPAVLLGATGVDGRAARASWLALGALGLASLAGVGPAAVACAGGLAAAGCVAAARRPALLACWGAGVVACSFAVYSGGDWAAGWRFLAPAAVPLAVLLSVGVGALRVRGGRAGGALGVLVLLGYLAANAHRTWQIWADLPASVQSVAARLGEARQLAARLHLDRPEILAPDIGAFLWSWDGPVLDLVGLTDVPIAQQGFRNSAFLAPYVLHERRPELVQIKLMAHRLGLRAHPDWQATYVTDGRAFVRRDLLLGPSSGAVPTDLGGGLALERWAVPAGQHVAGSLHLELVLRDSGAGDATLWAWMSSGDEVLGWRLPLGYGILPPSQWGDQAFTGHYELALPAGASPGTWALGLYVDDGRERGGGGRFAGGEVALGSVRVVAAEEALAEGAHHLSAGQAAAEEGRCAEAEGSWHTALAHSVELERRRPELARALATCWATAGGTGDRVSDLVRARRWDPRAPALRGAARAEADLWLARADAEAGVEALEAYTQALRADPVQPWVRRAAETLRSDKPVE